METPTICNSGSAPEYGSPCNVGTPNKTYEVSLFCPNSVDLWTIQMDDELELFYLPLVYVLTKYCMIIYQCQVASW